MPNNDTTGEALSINEKEKLSKSQRFMKRMKLLGNSLENPFNSDSYQKLKREEIKYAYGKIPKEACFRNAGKDGVSRFYPLFLREGKAHSRWLRDGEFFEAKIYEKRRWSKKFYREMQDMLPSAGREKYIIGVEDNRYIRVQKNPAQDTWNVLPRYPNDEILSLALNKSQERIVRSLDTHDSLFGRRAALGFALGSVPKKYVLKMLRHSIPEYTDELDALTKILTVTNLPLGIAGGIVGFTEGVLESSARTVGKFIKKAVSDAPSHRPLDPIPVPVMAGSLRNYKKNDLGSSFTITDWNGEATEFHNIQMSDHDCALIEKHPNDAFMLSLKNNDVRVRYHTSNKSGAREKTNRDFIPVVAGSLVDYKEDNGMSSFTIFDEAYKTTHYYGMKMYIDDRALMRNNKGGAFMLFPSEDKNELIDMKIVSCIPKNAYRESKKNNEMPVEEILGVGVCENSQARLYETTEMILVDPYGRDGQTSTFYDLDNQTYHRISDTELYKVGWAKGDLIKAGKVYVTKGSCFMMKDNRVFNITVNKGSIIAISRAYASHSRAYASQSGIPLHPIQEHSDNYAMESPRSYRVNDLPSDINHPHYSTR